MKNKVLICCALGMGTWVLAQSILLSGRVLDETSVPLEGASVQLVNQPLKTQTLADGSFSIVNLVASIQPNTHIDFKGDLLSIQLPQMEVVRITAINSKGQNLGLINQNFSAGALNLSLQRITQSLAEGSYILQISTPSIQAQYRILKQNQVSLYSDHTKFAKQDLDTLWISKQGYTDTKIPLQSYEQALGDLTLLSISSSSVLSSSSAFSSSVLSSSSSVVVSSNPLSSSVLSSALSSSVSLSSITSSSSSLSSSVGLSSALSSSNAQSSSSVQKFSQSIVFTPIPDQLLSVQRINVAATASSNLVVGFSSLTQNICTLTGNLVSFLGAGVCTISADQSGNTQYLAAPTVSRSFTIIVPLSSSAMSSSILSSSSMVSSSSVVSSAVLSSSVVSTSSGAVSSVAPSSSDLSSAISSSTAISSTTLSSSSIGVSSSSVFLLNQTIFFTPISDQLLSTQKLTLSVTSSSNLAVSLSSLTQNICALSGNLVSFLGEGVCTIDANQAGDTEYRAAPTVSRSFTIKAPSSSSVLSSSVVSSSVLSSSTILSSSSTLSSSSSNICTSISTWNSMQDYTVANTQVVYQNKLWKNQWYANRGEEPGVNSVWFKLADCMTSASSSSMLSSSGLSSSVSSSAVSSSVWLSSLTSSSSSMIPSSSSVVFSSSLPSSSSVATCTATPVANYYFNFSQGNTMLAGYQADNSVFQVNEWVVPVGVDCNQAQQISSVSGWNLYLSTGWQGASGTKLGIAKVTGSIVPGSSSVLTSSSSALSSSSQTSSSSGTGSGLGAWFTKSQFEALFAKRTQAQCIGDGNGIYTYENFIAAAARWPSFGTTGDETTRKKELAGVFAHFVQETGSNTADPTSGLCWVKERCAVSGACLSNYNQDWSGSYPPQPGKYYYGRGPKQLSWPGNYGWMSQEVYGDKMILLNNPDLIATDGVKAFESALWFWNQRSEYWTTPASPTLHAVMTQGAVLKGHRGFEATTFSVNGDLECSSGNQAMINRANNYLHFQRALGVPEANLDQSNLYCTFK